MDGMGGMGVGNMIGMGASMLPTGGGMGMYSGGHPAGGMQGIPDELGRATEEHPVALPTKDDAEPEHSQVPPGIFTNARGNLKVRLSLARLCSSYDNPPTQAADMLSTSRSLLPSSHGAPAARYAWCTSRRSS